MVAKFEIIALLFAVILSCSLVALSLPIALGDDASQQAEVVSVPPEVESVSIDQEAVTIVPGILSKVTITTAVYCASGIDQIKSVAITDVDPYPDCENMNKIFPLPLEMKRVDVEGLVRAEYAVTLEFLCIPADDYTLTVTATGKDGSTSSDTLTFTVNPTLAFSVTDVDYGSLKPGESSDAASTITNLGNVPIQFEEGGGIVPGDLKSGSNEITADNIAVDWDWSTVLKRTAPGEASFTLTVPAGTPPGVYTGKIVFTPTPA